MSEQVKVFLVGFVLLAGAFLLINWGLVYMNKRQCQEQWQESGMASQWTPYGRCRVQLPDGTWIPADRYRVNEQ